MKYRVCHIWLVILYYYFPSLIDRPQSSKRKTLIEVFKSNALSESELAVDAWEWESLCRVHVFWPEEVVNRGDSRGHIE